MTFAYVQNGVVVDVARVDPFGIFAKDYASKFLPAPDDVQNGWLYDGSTFTAPIVSIANLKTAKNNEINLARATANTSTFQYSGKTFACDQLSRSDIDGINGYVAIYAALPAGWPGVWKAVDNTYVLIPDVATWKLFYSAMVAAGNANFAHAQALKAQLAAATTAVEIAAVQW